MVSFFQGSRHGAGHLHRLWTNHGDGLDAGNPSNDSKNTEDLKILIRRVLVHVLDIIPFRMLEFDASRTNTEM